MTVWGKGNDLDAVRGKLSYLAARCVAYHSSPGGRRDEELVLWRATCGTRAAEVEGMESGSCGNVPDTGRIVF